MNDTTATEPKKRKAPRRSNIGGTVLQRADGRWEGKISLGFGGNGKRIRQSVYGKTCKDVQDQLAKLRCQKKDQTLVKTGRKTVKEFLDQWLLLRADNISDRTFDNYKRSIDKQIGPRIGGMQLSRLSADALDMMYAQMRTAKVGKDTIKLAHVVLHAALESAVKKYMVAINVADRVEAPKIERKEVAAIESEQVESFLMAAQGDRLESLFVLALGSGMRLGELFGLQWDCVDLTKGTVTVRRSLSELNGILKLKEPKTKSSRRQIAIPPAIVEALTDHRKRMVVEGHAKTLYVFCNQHGGPLRRSHFYRESFSPLLMRAKLPADTHFHHLRHAHAALLIQQGEHAKVISSRLGHSKIGITMDLYGHVMQGADRAAADRLNAMFPVKTKTATASVS
jgi:integrase